MKPPLVQLQSVKKIFRSSDFEVAALRDLSFDIREGEYFVIMGSSGSGKSTLLNILGCLDRVTSGRYILAGQDISSLDDDALSLIRSRRIGFVFQSFNLIPQLTVLENIEIPLYYQDVPEKEARERATALAERMGLGDRMLHRPPQLSGGQQQRVAIARALVSNPVIILADEPTGNLDSKTGDDILRVIDELNDEGRTIIMVTHDEAIAHRAHRIIRLRDGLIIAEEQNGLPQTVATPALPSPAPSASGTPREKLS
jgi:putative ABC transport system ATP-binding protein